MFAFCFRFIRRRTIAVHLFVICGKIAKCLVLIKFFIKAVFSLVPEQKEKKKCFDSKKIESLTSRIARLLCNTVYKITHCYVHALFCDAAISESIVMKHHLSYLC